MTIGMLGFLQPWILTALIALPVIWLLLRFTPPRPILVAFPPIRLLLGLNSEEETPARSPWWLTLLRLLVAALIIFALALPILNPEKRTNSTASDVLIVVDNGWTAASRWERRREILLTLLESAERNGQTVRIAPTAGDNAGTSSLAPLTPGDAREKAAGLEPMPYEGGRQALASTLSQTLPDAAGYNVIWLSDGVDNGEAESLAAVLQKIADGGTFSIMTDAEGEEALGLAPQSSAQTGLVVNALSPGGAPRAGRVIALSGRGERLAETAFDIGAGAQSAEVAIDLPLELRNQITRLEIENEAAAGAVYLLDSRSLWQRFGIISGEARESAQPLLSPTHYLERALAPYGEVIVTNTGNIAEGTKALLERKPSVLIFANIGQLVEDTAAALRTWVEGGGMLLRFAGPRLEKGGDELLPVPLRQGGRALGGALSWREPQKLSPFEENSPFYGLTIPDDVEVNRQVLADPIVELREETQVWARLQDGTPLVTASQMGEGWLVLFHVTASSSWSNLPISGLFVEMLRRTTELSNVSGAAPSTEEGNGGGSEDNNLLASSSRTAFLTPWQTLDGYGRLGTPPVTANALPASDPGGIRPGPRHPPGFYGQPGRTRALNIMQADSTLQPLDPSGLGAQSLSYQIEKPLPLMPWLLLAAFGLFAMDALITLILMSGGLWRRRAARAAAATIAAVVLTAAAGLTDANRAVAQDAGADDNFALQASLTNRLAYVITGDASTDEVSDKGLSGLSKVLAARTAIEPGEPMGVNVETDELVFFPVLYWPVLDDAEPLSEATLAKVDAYMKQGGMVVFDTKDEHVSFNLNMSGSTQWSALNRLIGKLDTPRLEPVPDGHVLTKAFYLLNGFPGRWDGGALWVEARAAEEDDSGERRALKADGVSSLLITSNDFAGAWALGEGNRPLYAVVPGGEIQREMAFRTGINIVMYALTGNYKADQVHVPALLERLGQ
jgi:hypothetical protein